MTNQSELKTKRFDTNFQPDIISPLPNSYELNKLELALNTMGYRLLFLPETPTTMGDIEKKAISEDASSLVILTDHQTQGVGRDTTKKWHDIPGSSILFSTFFNTNKTTTAEFADIIALKTCIALRKQGIDVLIKAPNDIVSSETGEKVGGVLVQNINGDENAYLGTNVGIGINVHYTKTQLGEYPTDYGATSLDVITGTRTNRQEILISILEAISTAEPEARVINHTPSVRKTQDDLWTKYSFLLGKDVSVFDGDLNMQGNVIKTQIGKGIVVKTPNGKEHVVSIFDTNTKVRLVN